MLKHIDARIEQYKHFRYKKEIDRKLALLQIDSIERWLKEYELQHYVFNNEGEAQNIITRIIEMLDNIEEIYVKRP